MSDNVGRWAGTYQDHPNADAYGDVTSYGYAYDWLKDCETIADWGSGHGYFATLFTRGQARVLRIDGSAGANVDLVHDLTLLDGLPETDGILLRHVIEHDYQWGQILDNALLRARQRLVLIVFTPRTYLPYAVKLARNINGVPDLALPHELIERLMAEQCFTFTHDLAYTNTNYWVEHIWRCERFPC